MVLKNIKSLISIHFAVLLFGVAGLFGKILDLHPLLIVLGRVFFASVTLFLLSLLLKINLKISNRKDIFLFILAGFILVFHWYSFFQSIQLSNVAVGLLTYATFPVFVAFLGPVFLKDKFKLHEMVLAVISFGGVLLIFPDFSFKNQYTFGILWGILSGLSFAILALFNRKLVQKYPGLTVAFYEDFFATIALLPVLFFIHPLLTVDHILKLLVLGVIFTAVAHTVFISGLKKISAQKASIIANMEPIYGIFFAIFLLHEIPEIREIAGGIIIMFAAFYATVRT